MFEATFTLADGKMHVIDFSQKKLFFQFEYLSCFNIVLLDHREYIGFSGVMANHTQLWEVAFARSYPYWSRKFLSLHMEYFSFRKLYKQLLLALRYPQIGLSYNYYF